jgi:hypothetical protein
MDLHREWRSPDFHARGALRFELLMLLFPLLLALSKRRPNPVELGLTLLWFHFALGGFRYVPLWVLLVTPVLSRCSLGVPALRDPMRRLAEGGAPLFVPRTGPAPWLGSVLVALALLAWARCTEGRFACHKPEIIPAAALDRFLEINAGWRRTWGERPVVFHSYDWGGYLTWHGGPGFRNWIDDRNEVQGKEHIQDYFSILQTDPGWDEKLDRAGVALVCVESGAALAYRLAEQPRRWRERYRDRYAVIFERATKTLSRKEWSGVHEIGTQR